MRRVPDVALSRVVVPVSHETSGTACCVAARAVGGYVVPLCDFSGTKKAAIHMMYRRLW